MRVAFDEDIIIAPGDTLIAHARDEKGAKVEVELQVRSISLNGQRWRNRVDVKIHGCKELRGSGE